MLARSAAIAVATFLGGLAVASIAPAHADAVLDGTYRLDFDGGSRMLNGAPSPTTNTSATYSFTSSCGQDGCVADAVLLNTNDTEAVSAHNPDLRLQFTDGAWHLSLPYDSPCEQAGTRNQLLSWTLTPQPGSDVLSGNRVVATVGQSCPGDQPGPMSQPVTATRVGAPAPGVLPMPSVPGELPPNLARVFPTP